MNTYRAIVIGGSAGSFPIVTKLLGALPKTYKLPIVLALHRLKHVPGGFAEALSYKSALPVEEPKDKQKMRGGTAYLAPANYHLMVEQVGHSFALSTEEMVKFSRPSIDVLFETAAYNYRQHLVGILLSGANTDGVAGLKRIKDRGGLTIVQNPEECAIKTMTEGAIKADAVQKVMSTAEISQFLNAMNNAHVY